MAEMTDVRDRVRARYAAAARGAAGAGCCGSTTLRDDETRRVR